jgi:hypothetical protein
MAEVVSDQRLIHKLASVINKHPSSARSAKGNALPNAFERLNQQSTLSNHQSATSVRGRVTR